MRRFGTAGRDSRDSGLGSELLQISPDEQRRAARAAALFSEEELTRFLQVMLRTFDELGYRQEQRFHFELGLLKLVHLRRLLPMEEALSSLAGGGGVPGGGVRSVSASQPRSTAPAVRSAAVAPLPPAPSAAPVRPAFSPFEQDRSRRGPVGAVGTPMPVGSSGGVMNAMVSRGATAVSIAPAARSISEPVAAPPVPLPEPVVMPAPVLLEVPSPAERRVEREAEKETSAPVVAPVAEALRGTTDAGLPHGHGEAAGGDAAGAQHAAVQALTAAKQGSAADAMEDASWTVAGSEAQVQTELSKTMLPVVMNPEAEKIVRAAVRGLGIMRLTLVPGTAAAKGAAKKPRAAQSGSAQARALEHPMVQEAQRLFSAEIQTVIDLREER